MSTDAPRVSVIIPTWNRAHTLREAIESALQQDEPALEILVSDDGSTDESESLVRSLGDPRVRWLAGPRAGRPAIPRNRALAASRGAWVAFLDSDDRWLPGKLRRQLALAEALGCLAVCGNALRVPSPPGADMRLLSHASQRLRFRDLLRENLVVCSAMMVHRSLLARIGGFPESASLTAIEDYAYWLRVATLTDIAFLVEPCVAYADDPDSSLRGRAERDFWRQRQRVLGDYLAWAPARTRNRLTARRAHTWASLRGALRAAGVRRWGRSLSAP